MVAVDELSKVAHFLPMKATFKEINIVDIIMIDIYFYYIEI